MRVAMAQITARSQPSANLAEVAELLGYGELSAFTRAYRRWYGEPPSKGWQAAASSTRG